MSSIEDIRAWATNDEVDRVRDFVDRSLQEQAIEAVHIESSVEYGDISCAFALTSNQVLAPTWRHPDQSISVKLQLDDGEFHPVEALQTTQPHEPEKPDLTVDEIELRGDWASKQSAVIMNFAYMALFTRAHAETMDFDQVRMLGALYGATHSLFNISTAAYMSIDEDPSAERMAAQLVPDEYEAVNDLLLATARDYKKVTTTHRKTRPVEGRMGKLLPSRRHTEFVGDGVAESHQESVVDLELVEGLVAIEGIERKRLVAPGTKNVDDRAVVQLQYADGTQDTRPLTTIEVNDFLPRFHNE